MKIEGRIFTPDGAFKKGRIEFDSRIRKVSLSDDFNKQELYVIPGLIDIHTHGAMGYDHSDGSPEGLEQMAEFYAKNGVTSFLATTMTLDENTLITAMRTVRQYTRTTGAKCAGVNLEGPFLSFEKKGAHKPEYLCHPDIEQFKRLYEASGNMIKLLSIAPELDGAIEFIREASDFCSIAVAHTAADYDTAMRAFDSGASHVTHLFNAMNPFLHRAPGVVGAARDAGANVEMICDGIHIHPSVIRATEKLFGSRFCMISDSIRCTGLPDGEYVSGNQPITVKDGKATLKDGTIAGSSISLMEGLRRTVSFGIQLEKAVAASTIQNACAIGMDNEIGSLEVGKCADMVVLNNSLEIIKVIINGEVLED